MTPSNTHPQTAARGPRRAFLLQAATGLLAALIAAPAPAPAQGVIQFSLGPGSFTRYKVQDNGADLRTLAFPQTIANGISATTRSNYPGGRQYLYVQQYSGVTTTKGNLRVWSEGDGSKPVTDFPGPYGVSPGSGQWSNDGQDSFVSFVVFDSPYGIFYTYRAWVSADEITAPGFQPIISLADTRLELLCDWGPLFYAWNHDGTRFYYKDPLQGNLMRAKTVGVGVTVADDPIVYTASFNLSVIRVSPVNEDHLVVGTSNGILAMDLATSNAWWLATPASTGSTQVRGPAFSPDGSLVAFGANRPDKKQTYHGVYKVPFLAVLPPRTTVKELTGPKYTSKYVMVNNWNLDLP